MLELLFYSIYHKPYLLYLYELCVKNLLNLGLSSNMLYKRVSSTSRLMPLNKRKAPTVSDEGGTNLQEKSYPVLNLLSSTFVSIEPFFYHYRRKSSHRYDETNFLFSSIFLGTDLRQHATHGTLPRLRDLYRLERNSSICLIN